MSKALSALGTLAAVLAVSAAAGGAAPPATAQKPDLDRAIAAMRKVAPSDFSKERAEAKAKEVDGAWKTIAAAGPAGAARLKRELAQIDAAREKDDYFKLGAAVLLWQIGNLGEAQAIADLWSGDVGLTVNYNYVFYTAFEAARTQDGRALPMLKAILRDKKGSIFRAQHVMNIVWPATHSFVWTAYGPRGLPALDNVLKTSADPVAQESAILVLTQAQYLPALPRIRQLAAQGQGGVRARAIWNLGIFGHPQDYEFLVAGLQSKDPKVAFDFAFAVFEYEDLRAAPHLVPLLKSENAELRREARHGLAKLLTPESLEAMRGFSAQAPTAEEREAASKFVASALKMMGLAWEQYAAKTPEEKPQLLLPIRDREEVKYRMQPGDRRLTHDEWLKAAEEWKQNGRLSGGTFAWVEDRHALAASTPADIDLWLQVEAKVCLRLSDECLPETEVINKIVKRLGRSRYRKEVGLCEKVEPVGPASAPAAK